MTLLEIYKEKHVFRIMAKQNINKSAKLTQNTPVLIVVKSMVMTTFLGAEFSNSFSACAGF